VVFALILALAIAAAACAASFPPSTGLDLRRVGSQLTLQVNCRPRHHPGGTGAARSPCSWCSPAGQRTGVARITLQTVGDDQPPPFWAPPPPCPATPVSQGPHPGRQGSRQHRSAGIRAQRPGTEQEMQGLLPAPSARPSGFQASRLEADAAKDPAPASPPGQSLHRPPSLSQRRARCALNQPPG